MMLVDRVFEPQAREPLLQGAQAAASLVVGIPLALQDHQRVPEHGFKQHMAVRARAFDAKQDEARIGLDDIVAVDQADALRIQSRPGCRIDVAHAPHNAKPDRLTDPEGGQRHLRERRIERGNPGPVIGRRQPGGA